MYNNNNYGYNPYYQQQRFTGVPQQPLEQMQNNIPFNSVQQRSTLNGKQVDSIEMAKNMEYPLDGSVSLYPVTDGSAIVTKQLQIDGTSKITIYKPLNEEKEEVKYLTSEDLEKALKKLNFDEIDDIKEELKEIKKQLKKKGE